MQGPAQAREGGLAEITTIIGSFVCVFCLSVLSVVVCWLLCRGRGRRVLAHQPLDTRLRGLGAGSVPTPMLRLALAASLAWSVVADATRTWEWGLGSSATGVGATQTGS